MLCCTRRHTYIAPPSTPANTCEWCDTDMSNQVVYLFDTQDIANTNRTSFRIGTTCCMDSGECASYCVRYINQWGTTPYMSFMYEPSHENVTQMFAKAKRLHAVNASRYDVKSAFQSAWNTYKRLTEADQALVVK
jgi:hypothetical protein